MSINEPFRSVRFVNDELILIDQTLLPTEFKHVHLHTLEEVFSAIREMQVRGAPAIGITAAYGLYMGIKKAFDHDAHIDFNDTVKEYVEYLMKARPTAVNLEWALRRMQSASERAKEMEAHQFLALLLEEARNIDFEDEQGNRVIGEFLASFIKDGMGVLTHCNAGALATSRYGTALAGFYVAKERGIQFKVYADETRPVLQGARLTAWELQQADIDVTLLCDNMAATVMSQGKVQAIMVGADRIAANGDTANKIGTYSVAVLASHFGIPFYVAAPTSTIDLNIEDGKQIPIEERPSSEVTTSYGKKIAPDGITVYNPAFDVTPSSLITAIVTEKGVFQPPYDLREGLSANANQ